MSAELYSKLAPAIQKDVCKDVQKEWGYSTHHIDTVFRRIDPLVELIGPDYDNGFAVSERSKGDFILLKICSYCNGEGTVRYTQVTTCPRCKGSKEEPVITSLKLNHKVANA